ncbi:hypothetical protein [Micromonospora sp. NPDC002717]
MVDREAVVPMETPRLSRRTALLGALLTASAARWFASPAHAAGTSGGGQR